VHSLVCQWGTGFFQTQCTMPNLMDITFCQSAIVSIALTCTIFELFDGEEYPDPEIWVRGH